MMCSSISGDAPAQQLYREEIMIVRRSNLIGLALLGLCVSLFTSCAPPGSGLQSYAQVAPQPAGTARVWFMRVKDPQELEQGDPIIFANGNPVGRSIPGIAFYRDYPPGTYAFTVQSYGVVGSEAVNRNVHQLAAGTQTYLEILWGASWLEGVVGGATFFVRTLPPELDQAYLRMLTDKGPPRAL
jgi:hypothetical protein